MSTDRGKRRILSQKKAIARLRKWVNMVSIFDIWEEKISPNFFRKVPPSALLAKRKVNGWRKLYKLKKAKRKAKIRNPNFDSSIED